MATLTHKTTILLSPHEHLVLKQRAVKKNTTMGELIRFAINKVFLNQQKSDRHKLLKGWEKVFNLNTPVSDWAEMEKEIIKGRLEK